MVHLIINIAITYTKRIHWYKLSYNHFSKRLMRLRFTGTYLLNFNTNTTAKLSRLNKKLYSSPVRMALTTPKASA